MLVKVYARLRAPFPGLGQISLTFTRAFREARPAARMSMLNQAMRQLRAEHDRAAADHRAELQQEDALNAAQIRSSTINQSA
jgi:hypothetical protein